MKDPPLKLLRDNVKYWERVSDDDVARDCAHWLGYGRWSNKDVWLQIGSRVYAHFIDALNLAHVADPDIHIDKFSSMVDWGCGGGSTLVAFGKHFKAIHAIDVSMATLEEAKKRAEQFKARSLISLWKVAPATFDSCPSGVDYDLFLSAATFQHFPSKEYGIAVAKKAFRILRSRGLAVIQIRVDDGSSYYRSKTRGYCDDKNWVRFTSYTMQEFRSICEKIGFGVLGNPVFEGRISYGWFYLLKP